MTSDEAAAKVADPETTDDQKLEHAPQGPAGEDLSHDSPPAESASDNEVPADANDSQGAESPPAPPDESKPAEAKPAESQADSAPGETRKRRVKLNPTFQPAVAKTAAPPTDSSATQAATEETAANDEETEPQPAGDEPKAEAKPAPPPPQPRGPVEIPRADENLDAELEAELAAAMESGELNAAVEAPSADAEAAESVELPESEDELDSGLRLTGKIQSIHGDDVFLDVGYRSPGVVPLRQFTSNRKPMVGQMIEVVVDKYDSEEGLIHLGLPRGVRRAGGDWDSVSVGQVVDCMVVKTNKGGLEANVGNLRGFMPASQVDVGFVSDLEQFVGQKLQAEITELNPKKRKLVLSRRKILAAERKEKEAELWESISVGQNFAGKVKTIKNYGAFVDIGGVDGFLHIGEISHSRIRHPSDVISESQEVHVQVISLDPEKKKIGLGMKQLVPDPWQAVTANYPAETTVAGKVTRVADFGAFVELEPGVEGLVHISEIDHSRVGRVADVLKVGQEIEAKVLEVDPDRNRISLSIKALKAQPESKREQAAEAQAEQYERKRKGPLKGGTSDTLSQGGGLFGNPNDFK